MNTRQTFILLNLFLASSMVLGAAAPAEVVQVAVSVLNSAHARQDFIDELPANVATAQDRDRLSAYNIRLATIASQMRNTTPSLSRMRANAQDLNGLYNALGELSMMQSKTFQRLCDDVERDAAQLLAVARKYAQ